MLGPLEVMETKGVKDNSRTKTNAKTVEAQATGKMRVQLANLAVA